MASTLLLDRTSWDIVLDASGNIAVATEPYSTVQDVASACRLFAGELWYDTTKGIRYFQQILGKPHPLAILKAQLATTALTVPDVESAVAVLSDITDRTVSGQVQVKLGDGSTQIVAL